MRNDVTFQRPILLDLPFPIRTPRLLIRPPQTGDGRGLNEAVRESVGDLSPWMPWARGTLPSIEDSEENCRRAQVRFLLREDIRLSLMNRASGKLLGSSGLHRFDWERGIFEIGYWVRTSCSGKGYVTEAVNAITRYTFSELKAKRVSIHCNVVNAKSRAIPERLGFVAEGTLKNSDRYSSGEVSSHDMVIYARTSAEGLPDLDVSW
jgi:RimJ/RimL family protein N-acetyltransferase